MTWYDSEGQTPPPQVSRPRPGDIRFAWPDLGLTAEFVSRRPSAVLVAPVEQIELLNVRRRKERQIFLLMQREFCIKLRLEEGQQRRLLGILEGSELFCFHKPHELPGGALDVQIPPAGQFPLYFDQPGVHSLGLILLGRSSTVPECLNELDASEDGTRKAAVKRIIAAARKANAPVAVLRVEFDVVI